MRSRAKACSNIAIIKYWGCADPEMNIPLNSSISITLEKLYTVTEVEFSSRFYRDEIRIDGERICGDDRRRIVDFLNFIRNMKGRNIKARVNSTNNFPRGAGLASSASGFAALAAAACDAIGLHVNGRELSKIARVGSGSAARSIYGGFVELVAGKDHDGCFAYQLAPPSMMKIRDLILIVSRDKKSVSSKEGHRIAVTSPLCECRIRIVRSLLPELRSAIMRRDFDKIGEIAERDAMMMHSVMMTSSPPLIYWSGETLEIMRKVVEMRDEGIKAYFTVDAGANVHVLTTPSYESEVAERLNKYEMIRSGIGRGVKIC